MSALPDKKENAEFIVEVKKHLDLAAKLDGQQMLFDQPGDGHRYLYMITYSKPAVRDGKNYRIDVSAEFGFNQNGRIDYTIERVTRELHKDGSKTIRGKSKPVRTFVTDFTPEGFFQFGRGEK